MIKKALFTILISTISILVIESCFCDAIDRIIVGVSDFRAFSDQNQENEINIINDTFFLHVIYDSEEVASLISTGLINVGYATQDCYPRYDNHIVRSSLHLSCDKPFNYKGNTISVDSNILSLPDIVHHAYGNLYLEVIFGKSFISNVSFDSSEYVFTLESETTDGKIFTSKLNLLMDLP